MSPLFLGKAICGVCVFALCATAFSQVVEIERASDETTLQAYETASGGYSIDEIVLDDTLRENFFVAIDPHWQTHNETWETETLLRLLSLRKAGKISTTTTMRGRNVDESIGPVAEIAARSVLDRHPVSSDVLLCDPRLRHQLQTAANEIVPDVDAYSIRKSVLRLRKTRRLRPELTLRVADWKRTIETFSRTELEKHLLTNDRISDDAGVYLFRDASGYLYIGEASDLRQRLRQHLSESDRVSLRKYLDSVAAENVMVELHTFGTDSPANQLSIRRAYESELIRSREPRLNVRP